MISQKIQSKLIDPDFSHFANTTRIKRSFPLKQKIKNQKTSKIGTLQLFYVPESQEDYLHVASQYVHNISC